MPTKTLRNLLTHFRIGLDPVNKPSPCHKPEINIKMVRFLWYPEYTLQEFTKRIMAICKKDIKGYAPFLYSNYIEATSIE